MSVISTLALGIAIVGLATVSPWPTTPTHAQVEQPRARRGPHIHSTVYGLHTLARAQSARLSVVNTVLGAPPDDQQPGEGTPPDPVRMRRVTLAFDIYEGVPPEPDQPVAADGSVHTLRFVRRVSHTLLLGPGEAASLEVEASRVGESVAAWVLGAPPEPIQPGEGSPPEPDRLALVTSLEVRQGNRTQFVLPGVTRGFDPQPDPPVHRQDVDRDDR